MLRKTQTSQNLLAAARAGENEYTHRDFFPRRFNYKNFCRQIDLIYFTCVAALKTQILKETLGFGVLNLHRVRAGTREKKTEKLDTFNLRSYQQVIKILLADFVCLLKPSACERILLSQSPRMANFSPGCSKFY